MVQLLRSLAQGSRAFVLTAGALLVLVIALADYLTGPEVRFFIFYWPPIAMVTWFVGKRWGFIFVALAVAGWVSANWGANVEGGRFSLMLWNSGVNAVSFAFLAYTVSLLQALMTREREFARTDFTTGAANGRAFAEAVRVEIARCRRSGAPISLAYLDLDDFKRINDRFGHSAGDDLLRRVAEASRAQLRAGTVLARLGGDEFAILLPGADAEAAHLAVERVRAAVGAVAAEVPGPVSLSVGVVTCNAGSGSPDDLLGRADALMYEVKSAGKNGVRHEVLSGER